MYVPVVDLRVERFYRTVSSHCLSLPSSQSVVTESARRTDHRTTEHITYTRTQYTAKGKKSITAMHQWNATIG